MDELEDSLFLAFEEHVGEGAFWEANKMRSKGTQSSTS